MVHIGTRLATLALVLLPFLPCVGVIGEMGPYDLIAGLDICYLPQQFCRGGSAIGLSLEEGEKYFYTNTQYNALWNYPALFHSMMCQLQFFREPDFSPYGYVMGLEARRFPGCATPETREASANDLYPTITSRNSAVGQLVPFFAAGGVTNLGILAVGPLMHAYGGSPLCVWPASNVVDVTGGNVSADTVADANPLKSGVGRGGCFDVGAWLSCTNAASAPQGFGTGRHPMAHVGRYIYNTLSPYFSIDWAAKGVPTSDTGLYPASYFLTASPAYLSPEAVPLNTSVPTLRIEPWRRSWEALGGLACVSWNLNANPLYVKATNEWHIGTVSSGSSNAVVNAIKNYMNDGHPDIDNTDYYPSDGKGTTKVQYDNQSGSTTVSVRPSSDYDPIYVFPRRQNPQLPSPLDGITITHSWSVTNEEEQILEAPVSNRTVTAENRLWAYSEKRWRMIKNGSDGAVNVVESGISTNDFGFVDEGFPSGEQEYEFERCERTGANYSWSVDEEFDPETDVEYSSTTNYMMTVQKSEWTDAAVNHDWLGIPASPWGEDSFARASAVCTFEDGGDEAQMRDEQVYFMGDLSLAFLDNILIGSFYSPDSASADTYQLPRDPVLNDEYGGDWGGNGILYRVETTGKPKPYNAPVTTNIVFRATYTNEYTASLGPDYYFEDEVNCDANTNVVSYVHALMPDDAQEAEEHQVVEEGTGFVPGRYAEVRSTIEFEVDNDLYKYFRVRWKPVRAWGVYSEVTNNADWPTN